MNRRRFFGTIAGLSGLIFSRKSESAQSEGLSHEKMAQVILKHPRTVSLCGDSESIDFFCTCIDCDYAHESYRQTKSVDGCIVKIRSHSPNGSSERLFDISNPLLKVIRLFDTPSRHFARFGEKWAELR